MEPTIMIVGLLILLLIGLWIGLRILGVRVITVKDGQQLVVSRLGRIHRILTPGPRIFFAGFERIEGELDVREQPHNFFVDGLFMSDVPFGYTLNIWYRNDLLAASQGDDNRWRELALFSDEERKAQASEKLRNALTRCLHELEAKQPAPQDSPLVARILPIFPGTSANETLLQRLQNELSKAWPSIGILPSSQHPIILNKVHLGKDLRELFSLGRTASQMRELLPNLSSESILRMFGSIEGLDMSHMRELTLRQAGDTAAELRIGEGEEVEAEIRAAPKPQRTPAAPVASPVSADTVPLEQLRKEDLRLLKQVPRAS